MPPKNQLIFRGFMVYLEFTFSIYKLNLLFVNCFFKISTYKSTLVLLIKKDQNEII